MSQTEPPMCESRPGQPGVLLVLGGTSLLFLAGASAIASVAHKPVAGYEISIYDSIPLEFWLCVVGAFLLFSLGLCLPIGLPNRWVSGWSLIGLTGISFLLSGLPVLRYGTFFDQWDVWFYLGDTTRLAVTGHIDLGSVVYPGLHTLWVGLAESLGISIPATGLLLGQITYCLRIPLVYATTKRVFGNNFAAGAAAALSAIPDGSVGSYPSPWFLSLTFLLLLAFVWTIREEFFSVGASSLALAVILALVVSHPLTPVFVILTFISVFFASRIGRAIASRKGEDRRAGSRRQSGTIGAYFIVVY